MPRRAGLPGGRVIPSPYIFQKIAAQGRALGLNTRQGEASRDWFRRKAKDVRGVNVNRLMSETKSRLFARGGPEDVGTMLCFFYDPKGKDTLPYWDQFPLCFPMSYDGDSFLDINLHYLPPVLRARLMDQLYTIAIRNNQDQPRRLALSYEALNGAARFVAFRPCIKRHLFSHMRSRMFYIRPEEWDICMMLPLQRFVGANTEKVWRDSRRIIRNNS